MDDRKTTEKTITKGKDRRCRICDIRTACLYDEKPLCDPCRSFYLRIRKTEIPACKYDGKCNGFEIRCCADCRMRKCRNVFEVQHDDAADDILEGKKIDGKWNIVEKLGEGAFGVVYKVKNGQLQCAMKTEQSAQNDQNLKMEVMVLRELEFLPYNERKHFLEIFDAGRTSKFNYIVFTLVGKSLDGLRRATLRKYFSLPCVIGISCQLLQAIKDLHQLGYLHRDIKPDNYSVGRGDLQRHVFMLDFGLARKYTTEEAVHRKPRVRPGFCGTVCYASYNCHSGNEQSRRDDLESWMFTIVELGTGILPWKHLREDAEVKELKRITRAKEGFATLFPKSLPNQFIEIWKHIIEIKYYDRPNYEMIKQTLESALRATGHSQYPYDWEKANDEYADDEDTTFKHLPNDKEVYGAVKPLR